MESSGPERGEYSSGLQLVARSLVCDSGGVKGLAGENAFCLPPPTPPQLTSVQETETSFRPQGAGWEVSLCCVWCCVLPLPGSGSLSLFF